MISQYDLAHDTAGLAVLGVTGAGTPAGDAVIRRLRQGGFSGRILGLGHALQAMAGSGESAPDERALISHPTRGWETFRSRLVDARRRFGMEALISGDDTEIPLLVRFSEELADDGIRTLLPTPTQFALRDRDKLAILAPRLDVRTPGTWRIRSHADLFRSWGECAKPAALMSPGAPARHADRFDEAAFLLEEIAFEHGGYVLLRAAPRGRVVKAIGLGDGAGRLATLSFDDVEDRRPLPERALRELRYVCENFAHVTRWRGAFGLLFSVEAENVLLHEVIPAPHAAGNARDPEDNLPMRMAALLAGNPVAAPRLMAV